MAGHGAATKRSVSRRKQGGGRARWSAQAAPACETGAPAEWRVRMVEACRWIAQRHASRGTAAGPATVPGEWSTAYGGGGSSTTRMQRSTRRPKRQCRPCPCTPPRAPQRLADSGGPQQSHQMHPPPENSIFSAACARLDGGAAHGSRGSCGVQKWRGGAREWLGGAWEWRGAASLSGRRVGGRGGEAQGRRHKRAPWTLKTKAIMDNKTKMAASLKRMARLTSMRRAVTPRSKRCSATITATELTAVVA